jgi:4-carboxymuconolactone decarboxylase
MPLPLPERALVRLATAVALGGDDRLASAIEEIRVAATPNEWVDEMILQAVVVVGFPRTLVAMRAWRAVNGQRLTVNGGVPERGTDYAEHETWTRAGERTCKIVYGTNYERLRAAVRDLHPALDAWMVTEGYGRTLSRPGLTLRQRELCMVAMVATLDTPHQLHSHLRGALNAGATPDDVGAVVEAIKWDLTDSARATAEGMWRRVGV